MFFRNNTKGRKSRSVFRTVLYPLFFVVLVEAFFLLGTLTESGVLGKLNQNEREILTKQVQTRGAFLQNAMNNNWADLSLVSSKINETTQRLLDKGEISFEDLDQGSKQCEVLLSSISNELLSTIYVKRASGVFVIFNTHDLEEAEYISKPGVYIRDFDPLSPPSPNYADLLFRKAPISLVKSMNISTDRDWEPLFKFPAALRNYDFFYQPYQAAYYNRADSSHGEDYGYWSATSIMMQDGDNNSIIYSVPLILEDGTVYGVLGIELLSDYLKTILPYDELYVKGGGTYVLASQNKKDLSWKPITISGYLQADIGDSFTMEQQVGGVYSLDIAGRAYIAHLLDLPLGQSNSPYLAERWSLIGMVQREHLYSFSNQVVGWLRLSFFLTILVGIIGSILVSRRFSRPISKLSEEVSIARKSRGGIPELSVTNIREIDQFAEAFTALSKDVVNSSARFLSILDMASVKIGGFEVQQKEKTVFATKTFFELFGWENIDVSDFSLDQFGEMMESMRDCISPTADLDGSTLYHLELQNGDERYIRIKIAQNEERVVGIAEDVTISTMERLRIEHERDYDLLTGLFNRRAFYRKVFELFKSEHMLKNAAVLMIDIDNLKVINDKYGHDCGDKYIRRAGRCFVENLPKATISSRVSGDEFFFFLYGYESKARMRQILEQLQERVDNTWFQLPDGESQKIGISGGIAWYPDNSQDFLELMKMADFAMYQVKHAKKGAFWEFSQEEFDKQEHLNKMRKELKVLIEEESLSYHFQPIVDGKTGQIFAYEALMRVHFEFLRSPDVAMQIAKEERRLQDIERITWFKSMEAYQSLLDKKQVPSHCLLFINSIANHCLSEEDGEKLCMKFADVYPKVVMEIVESEDMHVDALKAKRKIPCFSGIFALDDYGTGYNSEKNLLEIAPTFIKVDKTIIRNIHMDRDKQKIVSNIVAYAHERNLYIIAEGVETRMELEMLLAIGVDLLQGYFLAKPQRIPVEVYPEALETIQDFWEKHKKI